MKTLFSIITCSLFSTLAASSILFSKDKDAEPSKGHEKPCCEVAKCCEAPKCCDMCFAFDASALILQPNGSNLYYGAEAIPLDPSITLPAASPNWNILELKPNYHLGFQFGFNSNCPNSCISTRLSWEHLKGHNTASFEVPISSDMVGPMFDIGPDAANYKIATGRLSFNFDAVNLLFGTKMCSCGGSSADLFTGATFGYIAQNMKSQYSSVDGTIKRIISSPSTFMGVGPIFGVALNSRFCGCFSFVANSSMSLIMGQLKNHTTYQSFTPELEVIGIAQPNVQTTSVPKRWQLIPGLEESIGFNYHFTCNCWKFAFGAGYLAQIYLNAVQTVDMTAPQVLPGAVPNDTNIGVFAVGFERTLSNFIMTGPYITLVLDF